MQSLNSSTLFPCQQCCQVTTSWQVSNVAMRRGAPSTQDGKTRSSSAPRGLHRHLVVWPFRHSKTPWQQKKGTWGQEPMQFTCSSFGQQKGQGRRGAIKILQINYTKKKGKLFIYEICTRPSLRRHHLYELCSEERGGGKKKKKPQWLSIGWMTPATYLNMFFFFIKVKYNVYQPS